MRVMAFESVASFVALACVATAIVHAATPLAREDEWTERSLAVVQNVYLAEGVTIRHLGRIRSVPGLDRGQLDVAMRAAPRELMNFSAALGAHEEDLLFAYAVSLEGAAVGYEGLVFDPARVFNLEDAWHDVFHRPEALTLNQSPDKPRIDPADNARVVVNWGNDWPEHRGWRGWSCAACAGEAGGGLRGSGPTWEYWGRIVTVLQRSAHAYYHFVAECLPKLLLVSTDLDEHPDAVVLMDESYGGRAWTREFFSMLGVSSSQLVSRTPGRVYLADTVHLMKPTPLHRGHSELIRIMSQRLIHAAALGSPVVRGHVPMDSVSEKWARQQGEEADTILLVVRTPTNNQHSQQHAACKLSGGCKVREVVNSEELRAALQKDFSNLRVRVFDSAGMPVREQILLFSRAVAVVGAHGAGLSNVIFAPPGGVVLELLPEMLQRASVHMIFWHLSASVGHRHASYIVPHNLMTSDNSTALHNFRVPVPDVVRHLRSMLLQSPILAARLHLLL